MRAPARQTHQTADGGIFFFHFVHMILTSFPCCAQVTVKVRSLVHEALTSFKAPTRQTHAAVALCLNHPTADQRGMVDAERRHTARQSGQGVVSVEHSSSGGCSVNPRAIAGSYLLCLRPTKEGMAVTGKSCHGNARPSACERVHAAHQGPARAACSEPPCGERASMQRAHVQRASPRAGPWSRRASPPRAPP